MRCPWSVFRFDYLLPVCIILFPLSTIHCPSLSIVLHIVWLFYSKYYYNFITLLATNEKYLQRLPSPNESTFHFDSIKSNKSFGRLILNGNSGFNLKHTFMSCGRLYLNFVNVFSISFHLVVRSGKGKHTHTYHMPHTIIIYNKKSTERKPNQRIVRKIANVV